MGKSSIIRQLTGKKIEIGKKPGVTRKFDRIKLGKKLDFIDLPGFGYISGISESKQEKIKTKIVRYLENRRERILFAIQVVDASTFLEIASRWKDRGQIPVDVELFDFLEELNLNPIVAVNKIDKVKNSKIDETLDKICVELGLDPPWKQWLDIIVPTSAKTGRGIDKLDKLIQRRFRDLGKEELLKYL